MTETDRHYDTDWGLRCYDATEGVWRFNAPLQSINGVYTSVVIEEQEVASHERCVLYARMDGWSRGLYYHEGDRIHGPDSGDVGPLVPALPPDEVARLNGSAMKALRKSLHVAGFRQYTADGEIV